MTGKKQRLIQQGAEAKIILDEKSNTIIKNRIPKTYRIPELDKKIRKRRTKAETKLLTKSSEIISSPSPEKYSEKEFDKIKMPFIKGKKLSEHLDKFPLKEQKQIINQIGKSIAKLHKNEIIHGDLTTSNLILVDEKSYFKKQLEEVKKLKLIKEDFVISGSGPLAIRSIRNAKDIDLIVTKNLWNKLSKKHSIEKKDVGDKIIETINIGNIEIQNDSFPENKKAIENSEFINGLPFLRLETLIQRKKSFGRKKDLEDVQLIKNYLNKKEVIISKDPKIHFIDFGLGYISRKIEDKAVDLHLLKQALEAKHFKNWKELFKELSKSYEKTLDSGGQKDSKKVFERMRAVEKRGRYRH